MDAYERAVVISAMSAMRATDDLLLQSSVEIIKRWVWELESELGHRKLKREADRERVGPGAE